MRDLTKTAVNVYAILKDFRGETKDYLVGLLPFFEPLQLVLIRTL